MRGLKRLRWLDSRLGPLVLSLLAPLVILRRRILSRPKSGGDAVLLCLGAIGDVLLLSAVARKSLVGTRVILVCTRDNHIAAAVFPGLFDEVAILRLWIPWDLWRLTRGRVVSDLYDSTQWANASAMQCAFLKLMRPSVRIHGFHTPIKARGRIYDSMTCHSRSCHETENFRRLLRAAPFPANELIVVRPTSEIRRIMLHPWPSGIRSHLKEWPQEAWAELARRLHGLGAEIVVTGSHADFQRSERLISTAGIPATNLAGKLALDELFLLIGSESTLMISVNTGTMHLAALAGAYVLAITGPTNPNRWGPIGDRSRSITPNSGPAAYLHYGFEYPKVDAEAYSLDRLSVAEVFDAVQELCTRARLTSEAAWGGF